MQTRAARGCSGGCRFLWPYKRCWGQQPQSGLGRGGQTAADLLRQVENMARGKFFTRAFATASSLGSGSKKLISPLGDGQKAGKCKRTGEKKWGQELGVKGWLLGSALPRHRPWASRDKLYVWIENRWDLTLLTEEFNEGSDNEIRGRR